MKRRAGILLLTVFLGLPVSAVADAERGRLLYENHCTSCHTSTLHIREQRKARTAAELRAWIQRWNGELRLGWQAEDLEDVFRHLNNRYYRLPLETPR